ncbi:MAG: hypothetical protein ACI4J1_01180 [Ruminiclostridium sp.]
MNCKKIVDNMWSEIYGRNYHTDDHTFEKVLERAKKTESKAHGGRGKRKYAAAIALAAAAAVITVSAGAAFNFDFVSLFGMGKTAAEKEAYLVRDWLMDLQKESISEINIPRGAEANSDYTERDIDFIQSMFRELDQSFDYGDRILHIGGYVYDGLVLYVMYDVTYKGEIPHSPGSEFWFSAEDEGSSDNCRPLHIEDKTVYCFGRTYAEIPEDKDSMEIMTCVTLVDGFEFTPNEDYKPIRFNVSRPQNTEVIRFDEIDKKVVDNSEAEIYLRGLTLSTLGAKMTATVNWRSETHNETLPLYVTYDDGTVLDLSEYTGNVDSGTGAENSDGSFEMTYFFGRNMNIVDTDRVKSVQIFNEVIVVE